MCTFRSTGGRVSDTAAGACLTFRERWLLSAGNQRRETEEVFVLGSDARRTTRRVQLRRDCTSSRSSCPGACESETHQERSDGRMDAWAQRSSTPWTSSPFAAGQSGTTTVSASVAAMVRRGAPDFFGLQPRRRVAITAPVASQPPVVGGCAAGWQHGPTYVMMRLLSIQPSREGAISS